MVGASALPVDFGPVTPELTALCERLARHGKQNWRIYSNISGSYTGPIFAIFSPYDNALCVDDGSVPFSICQGTLSWLKREKRSDTMCIQFKLLNDKVW